MLPERLSFVYLCSSDPLCCLSSPLCLGVAAARAEGAGDVSIPRLMIFPSKPSPFPDTILPLVQFMVSPEHTETGKELLKYGIAGRRRVGRRRTLCGHSLCHSSTPVPALRAPLWPSSEDFLLSLCHRMVSRAGICQLDLHLRLIPLEKSLGRDSLRRAKCFLSGMWHSLLLCQCRCETVKHPKPAGSLTLN